MPTTRGSSHTSRRGSNIEGEDSTTTTTPPTTATTASSPSENAARPRQIKKHRKVRTGCETCKGRKVKCDEARPICGNCSYQKHSCIYRQKQQSYPIFGDAKNDGQKQLDDERDVLRFSSRDMGLLHHWIIHTAQTIGATAELRALMRDQVPTMAIDQKKPYLLHAALAVTALHYAFLHPSQRDIYRPLGRHHYAIALPLFRENLPFINPDNCHALYSCSQTIVKYLFAVEANPARFFFPPTPTSPNDNDGSNTDSDPIAEMITLIKGAYLIRETYHSWLSQGPLAAVANNLMKDDATRSNKATTSNSPPSSSIAPYTTELTRLDSLLAHLSGHDGTTNRLSIVRTALASLLRLLSINSTSDSGVRTKGLCTAWLSDLPSEFFTAVRERKPEALVVLSHFCVVLEEVNCDEVWYMKGWSRCLWRECVKGLGGGWEEFVIWPMSVFNALEEQEARIAGAKEEMDSGLG